MMPDHSYIFQDWLEMNPPTLMLPLIYLIENQQQYDENTKERSLAFMKDNFRNL